MTSRGEATPIGLESYDGKRGGEHIRLGVQQAKGMRASVYRGAITDTALGLATKVVPNIGSLILGTDDPGHIAFRGAADRPDRLAASCRKVFGEPSATALRSVPVERIRAARPESLRGRNQSRSSHAHVIWDRLCVR